MGRVSRLAGIREKRQPREHQLGKSTYDTKYMQERNACQSVTIRIRLQVRKNIHDCSSVQHLTCHGLSQAELLSSLEASRPTLLRASEFASTLTSRLHDADQELSAVTQNLDRPGVSERVADAGSSTLTLPLTAMLSSYPLFPLLCCPPHSFPPRTVCLPVSPSRSPQWNRCSGAMTGSETASRH